jgi:GNAT superfamily N-acetyltransferase
LPAAYVIIANVTSLTVRVARRDDLPAIEQLVADMFRDLGTARLPAAWGVEMKRAFVARLGRDVGAYVAVDSSDRPVAAAVGVVDQRLPSPRRLTGRVGYVEWLATDARYRRQGAARLALHKLLDWFDRQGVEVVDVHASDAAIGVYAEVGFEAPHATPLRRRRSGAKR